MIILVNGAFGIGKTTVARALVEQLPNSMLYDPEIAGMILQKSVRFIGHTIEDFQDLPLWRMLTVAGARIARIGHGHVVVPMAISNIQYLTEIRDGLAAFESRVLHFCLVAPVAIVHQRLHLRGATPDTHGWEFRRATECCVAHQSDAFREHLNAADRTADAIAHDILKRVG